jgi:hypothetical protein
MQMVIKLVFNLYQNSLRGGASKKNAQNKRKTKKNQTKKNKSEEHNKTTKTKQLENKDSTEESERKNKNNANWLPMLILKDTLGTSAEQMKNRETIQF